VGATIVCAVDSEDPDSRGPLKVAADMARRLDRPLVVAYVAPPGFLAAGGPAPIGADVLVGLTPTVAYPYPVAPAAELGEVRDEARRRVERLLGQWGVEDCEVEVALDVTVAEGLRRIATDRDAELLIVGSRGRGTLRAALLGSTSHALAGDAPCPVVVVQLAD